MGMTAYTTIYIIFRASQKFNLVNILAYLNSLTRKSKLDWEKLPEMQPPEFHSTKKGVDPK